MNMKVLVTSATGLTGRSVVKELADRGVCVRAMVHSEARINEMQALGASQTVIASIENETDLERAMTGMEAVFYICPTAHPEEGNIGRMAVDIAERIGIPRFIYQSVHNSIEPDLPHHRQKLMVEQHLLESKLNYSILRPAAFMQNILTSMGLLSKQHIFTQRFFTSIESCNRINLIDVADYARVVAEVVTEHKYDFGCFDLCGPENLSAKDMVHIMEEVIGQKVSLRYITDDEFIEMSRQRKMAESTLSTLLAMFRAYNRYGFKGNSLTTEFLLGRKPSDFREFLHANMI